jgi:hypothetical protein
MESFGLLGHCKQDTAARCITLLQNSLKHTAIAVTKRQCRLISMFNVHLYHLHALTQGFRFKLGNGPFELLAQYMIGFYGILTLKTRNVGPKGPKLYTQDRVALQAWQALPERECLTLSYALHTVHSM